MCHLHTKRQVFRLKTPELYQSNFLHDLVDHVKNWTGTTFALTEAELVRLGGWRQCRFGFV